MKVTALDLIKDNCDSFVLNFIDSIIDVPNNKLLYDKSWKKSNEKLAKVTLSILKSCDSLNTAEEFQDKTAVKIGRIGAGVTTASSEPVDNALVAPNARGGLLAVTIATGINLGQLLYLFRTAYTTVKHLKQTAVFGQLMQSNMLVEQFSTRIKKIAFLIFPQELRISSRTSSDK
ncbi:2076_t:CDS:2 [Funneliformis geosporum]|nr:2076_t:CDS:2 [Funneliformis geosporum]